MPLLWLSLAFLCGILFAERFPWSLTGWLVLAGTTLGLGLLRLVLLRYLPPASRGWRLLQAEWLAVRWPAWLKPPLACFIILTCFFLGASRLQATRPLWTPDFIGWYNDQDAPFVVEGVLQTLPDERDSYTNLLIRVESLSPAGDLRATPVHGELLAKVPPGGDWHYGDRLRLEGYLRTPFATEEFSYRGYLARQGIYSTLSCSACTSCPANWSGSCVVRLGSEQSNPFMAWIYDLKAHALEVVYRLFPDPEASLLAGILLGVESGIPADVQEAFNATGTTHIIAISGFNFAIIAGLFMLLFTRLLGRWRGMLAAFVAIGLYALLAGPGASVIRAAIMGCLTVFGNQIGRRQHSLNTLTFVAALMALQNPFILWDVGFQLSFMATLGLMLYAGPLSDWFVSLASQRLSNQAARRLAGPVGEYFLFTLAAQLTTLPVILYHFRRLSMISLVANPLILPAQPTLMILGGLAVILGLVSPAAGQILAYLTWPLARYTISMVEALANWGAEAISLAPLSLWLVALFYAALLGWTYSSPATRQRILRGVAETSPRLAIFSLALASLLAVVVWQAVMHRPDGRLHLTLLDVGNGDALLVQTPGGRYLLIDGGSSATRLGEGLGRRLPLVNRRLDYLVIAGSNEEQLVALPRALERFPPERVLWSGPPVATLAARQLRQALGRSQALVLEAQTGQSLDLGDGAELQLILVGKRGAVLLLQWGNFRALLPTGMDFDSMQALLSDRRQAPVTALLLADSGYAPLNTAAWIERWQPQVVLLSVAMGNTQGRPDLQVLQALEGYTLLRTDRNGWIELSTDGKQLWVEVEKP